MSDGKKVGIGILVFLILATFPFWYGKGKAIPAFQLKIDTPEIQRLAEKKCLEPTAYMRASHMELIHSWREAVVRDGQRVYCDFGGKKISHEPFPGAAWGAMRTRSSSATPATITPG